MESRHIVRFSVVFSSANLRVGHFVAATLLALWASAAPAQESPSEPDTGADNGFRFSGFGTAGLTRSGAPRPWTFVRDGLVQPGHDGDHLRVDVDSRLGLQVNYSFSPEWEGVVQAVAQPMASKAPVWQRVEWAYLGWHPNSYIGVQVGRIANDAFLLDAYRNVGYAYPWVRPNVDFYSGLPNHIDGADAQVRIPDSVGEWRIKLSLGRDNYVAPSDSGGTQLRMPRLGGIIVSHESSGLTLRGSLMNVKTAGEPASLNVASASLAWEYSGWTATSEYSAIRSSDHALVGHSAYASVGYRFKLFTPFAMASRSISATSGDSSSSGDSNDPAQTNNYNETAKSVGLRWDWSSRADLKFQLDRYHVHADGGALWNVPDNPRPRSIDVLSVTLDTVF